MRGRRGGQRRKPARLFLALITGWAAVGCTFAPSSSPSGESSAVPGTTPPTRSPWQEELANLEPDGTRSLQSALALFAMAFGPLPGVSAETAEAGTIGSASPAVRAVAAHRDQLTDEQRAAIDGYLTVSNESKTIDVAATRDLRIASGAGLMALAGLTAVDDGYDPLERDLERLGMQASRAAARYFGEMPARPDGKPGLSVRTTFVESEPFVTFFNPTFGPGGFEGCDVHVNRANATDDRGQTARSLTLDVIHCYQSWRMGSEQGFDGNVPAWAWEGPAEYIMLETFPPQPGDALAWATYLGLPDLSLFERTYDAFGAYAQAFEAGVDLSSAFVAVLNDVDNPKRFALAGLASNAFLDKWASELSQNSRGDWGDNWSFLPPGGFSYQLHAPEQSMPVAVGSLEAFSQDAYSNHLFALAARSDIVRVSANGRVRIADGEVDEVILGGTDFCITDKGCGPCPDGSEPSIRPTPLTSSSVLAVSGGTDGTNGTVSGHALEEFCEDEEDEFCVAYRALLHWWWLEATNTGTQAWAAEIVRRFQEMRPLAQEEQQEAVDVHIGLYTAYATLSGPEAVRAAVPWAEQMPQAVDNLDTYCDITPADRGG